MQAKRFGIKAQRIGQVFGKNSPNCVRLDTGEIHEGYGEKEAPCGVASAPRLEPIVIFGTAIKIDFHACELRGSSDVQRIVAVPK